MHSPRLSRVMRKASAPTATSLLPARAGVLKRNTASTSVPTPQSSLLSPGTVLQWNVVVTEQGTRALQLHRVMSTSSNAATPTAQASASPSTSAGSSSNWTRWGKFFFLGFGIAAGTLAIYEIGERKKHEKDAAAQFHVLCSRGNTPRVREWLDQMPKLLNWKAADNSTPLLSAIESSQSKTATLLIERGADVNVRRSDGVFPLLLAAHNGDPLSARALLKNKAKVNDTWAGSTALFIAAERGYVPVVHELLQFGADTNLAQAAGITPLYVACQNGHYAVVRRLLAGGANVNHKWEQHQTSPLFIAAQQGHLDIVKLLIEKGADISTPNAVGTSPIGIAELRGHDNVANFLKQLQLRRSAPLQQSVQLSHA